MIFLYTLNNQVPFFHCSLCFNHFNPTSNYLSGCTSFWVLSSLKGDRRSHDEVFLLPLPFTRQSADVSKRTLRISKSFSWKIFINKSDSVGNIMGISSFQGSNLKPLGYSEFLKQPPLLLSLGFVGPRQGDFFWPDLLLSAKMSPRKVVPTSIDSESDPRITSWMWRPPAPGVSFPELFFSRDSRVLFLPGVVFSIDVVPPKILKPFKILKGGFISHLPIQLVVNWWFGMLGVPLSNSSFHFQGCQESRPPGPKPPIYH